MPARSAFRAAAPKPYDPSPIDTALRETEEEIGLARRHIEVLGTLPDYFTGTGYRVTPVVGLVTSAVRAERRPVRSRAEIFEVPLAFLMDGMNHQRRSHRGCPAWRRRSVLCDAV